CQHSFRTPYTF
nr:immunoglobulin light chain junction region [Macaca mulatta]